MSAREHQMGICRQPLEPAEAARSQFPRSPSVLLHASVMQLKNELHVHCRRVEAESFIVNTFEFLGLWASRSEVAQRFNAGVGWAEEPAESPKHVARKSDISDISDIGWQIDRAQTDFFEWIIAWWGGIRKYSCSGDESWAVSVSSTVRRTLVMNASLYPAISVRPKLRL